MSITKKKIKRIMSKTYAESITKSMGKVIKDKHLRKASENFSKALHGKKVRNTSGV